MLCLLVPLHNKYLHNLKWGDPSLKPSLPLLYMTSFCGPPCSLAHSPAGHTWSTLESLGCDFCQDCMSWAPWKLKFRLAELWDWFVSIVFKWQISLLSKAMPYGFFWLWRCWVMKLDLFTQPLLFHWVWWSCFPVALPAHQRLHSLPHLQASWWSIMLSSVAGGKRELDVAVKMPRLLTHLTLPSCSCYCLHHLDLLRVSLCIVCVLNRQNTCLPLVPLPSLCDV